MNNEISQIKVSVITPTFNDGLFIRETIESVLNQSHQNFEIIIVDDCSNDNTIRVIEAINDPRIKLLKNSVNRGAAFSRNRAILAATGDYLAFLDGDDIWKQDKLVNQLSFMRKNKFDFSATYYSSIDQNGNDSGKMFIGPSVVSHKDFLRMNYCGCLTVMYRRDIFPNLQIPETILKRNDYALWLKLSELTPCYFLPEVLAIYRNRKSQSISSGKKRKLFAYHVIMFQELYGFSKIKASIFALRNAIFYLFVKNKFVRK